MTTPTTLDGTAAHDLLSGALRNTRDAEVFWAREEAVTAGWLDGAEQAREQAVETVALRVIQSGRLGFAVHVGPLARLDATALLASATREAAAGRLAPATFSKDREPGVSVPTWDEEVAALDENDLRRLARQAAFRLRDMLGGAPYQVAVRRLVRRTLLLTRMAERQVDKTLLQFRAQVGPTRDGATGLTETWAVGRAPDDPLAALGNLAWLAALGRENASVPTSPCRVVLGPRAVAVVMRWLCEAQTGLRLLANNARWDKAMLGRTRVVDERVTIVDNPLRPWALPSSPYDAEGLPRARHTLIENGVLAGLLLDLATAHHLELEPTASATRGIDSAPEPSPSFLELAPGAEGFESLLTMCEGGVYFDSFEADAENEPTQRPDEDGWFAVRAGAAFAIRDGRPRGALGRVILSGNVYELFGRHLMAVGGDRVAGQASCCGSLALRDMTISE